MYPLVYLTFLQLSKIHYTSRIESDHNPEQHKRLSSPNLMKEILTHLDFL